jgi:hypothetical protein
MDIPLLRTRIGFLRHLTSFELGGQMSPGNENPTRLVEREFVVGDEAW